MDSKCRDEMMMETSEMPMTSQMAIDNRRQQQQ
jgi:hypothetical protein